MGDAVVDDVKRVLSDAGIEPSLCPKCGSRKMQVSYSRDFIVCLGEDEFEYEAINSDPDPFNITCFECGETIYES